MLDEVSKGLVRVAGNSCLDVLVRDAGDWSGPARDGWGSNVEFLGRPIEAVLGGVGAAPAYLLGKLGQRVQLNTNLGEDSWGAVLQAYLEAARVAIHPGRAVATATNLILLSPEGERRSMYYAGDKVDWRLCLEGETPEFFLASGFGLVQADDLEALRQVFAELRQRGTKIVFDPSPWFAGRVEVGAMLQVWQQLFCLVATEEELQVWHQAPGAEELARQLLEAGPENVVVKRGPEGAAYAAKGKGSGVLPTDRVESANTVGAGDTFNGRLIYGLCQGESLKEAVGAAVTTATRVARRGRGVLGALD
jgi:fructokinase